MEPELLDSAALMVAVSGLLYATWFGEISRAKAKPKERYRRNKLRAAVRGPLLTRSLPLTLILTALTAVFASTAWTVAPDVGRAVFGDPAYDASEACFVVVYVVLVVITSLSWFDLFKLANLFAWSFGRTRQ